MRTAVPLLLGILIIAACTSSGGNSGNSGTSTAPGTAQSSASGGAGSGDPVNVVEQYLTAKVAANKTALQGLLCSSMEADLNREATSFAGLSAKLNGMSCQLKSGTSDVVTCTGQIVATYGTEDTTFPLASYKVVQDDGEWKWCGEAP